MKHFRYFLAELCELTIPFIIALLILAAMTQGCANTQSGPPHGRASDDACLRSQYRVVDAQTGHWSCMTRHEISMALGQ